MSYALISQGHLESHIRETKTILYDRRRVENYFDKNDRFG